MLSAEDLDFQAALAGKYSLDRELGRGGMGIVYLAREALLDRAVAIKRLPSDFADDPVARERFVREARTAAQLFHPNIVPIHRVDEIGPFVFFVMGYVEGETAGELVRRRGKLPVHDAVRILRDAAYALGYGHARGVVHRDVKPDNLLIEKSGGRTLVTDFGIAQQAGASALTTDGQLLGSVHYMSPEQISGQSVDGRADVYALGAIAHVLLTGNPPFDNPAATAVLGMHLNQPAPPIASLARGIPGRLAAAIDRCLAKNPAERFATAEAFAEALAEVEGKRAIAAPLRAWASGGGWVDPGLFLIGLITLMVIGYTQDFWFLWVPPAYALIQRMRVTQNLLASGYDATDLSAALIAEVERRSEESASHFSARPPLFIRVLRWAAVIAAVTSVGLMMWSTSIVERINWATVDTQVAVFAARIGRASVFLGFVAIVNGIIAEAISPSRILDKIGGSDLSWRMKFWRSRAGAAFAKWLKRGRRNVAQMNTDRPTEMIVGGAAQSLYEALPKETRKELGALPAVVEQLELRARELRSRRQKMEQFASEAAKPAGASRDAAVERTRAETVEELGAARARVDEQLASTIAALETIRLDLLRLHAGRGSTADLTAALNAAMAIGDEVSITLESRAEADRAALGN